MTLGKGGSQWEEGGREANLLYTYIYFSFQAFIHLDLLTMAMTIYVDIELCTAPGVSPFPTPPFWKKKSSSSTSSCTCSSQCSTPLTSRAGLANGDRAQRGNSLLVVRCPGLSPPKLNAGGDESVNAEEREEEEEKERGRKKKKEHKWGHAGGDFEFPAQTAPSFSSLENRY